MVTVEPTDQELDFFYKQEIIADPDLTKKQKLFLEFYLFKYPNTLKRTKRCVFEATQMYFGWSYSTTYKVLETTVFDKVEYKKLLDAAQKRIVDRHEESIKNSPSLAEEGPI